MRFSKPAVIFFAAVCFASAGLAQESATENAKPSTAWLKLQLEFQTQRLKLLKANLELLKSLQKTELEQARAQVALKALEIDLANADIKQHQASVQFAKKQFDRVSELYKQKAVDQRLLDETKSKLEQGEAALVKANVGVKHKTQEATSTELELKRLQLHAAVEINEAQLEILAAEHDVKLSQLELPEASE